MLGKGYKVLCIGSGGVRGLAFVGALKRVDYGSIREYCGISVGSILSMCLAVGYSPNDLDELCMKTNFKSLIRFSVDNLFSYKEKRGFMNVEGLRIFLGELLKAKGYSVDTKMSDIPNLGVVVSNLSDRRGELWMNTDDKVIDSVIASSSIPFLMEPYMKDNKYYVDGCLYVDCASELHSSPSECFSMSLMSDDVEDLSGSIMRYVDSILQGPRVDRCRKYFNSRPEGSYVRILLNGINTMDTDISNEKRREIIDYYSTITKSET